MTGAELEALWAQIDRPQAVGDLAGRRLPGAPDSNPVFAVVDWHGRFGLFVTVGDSDSTVTGMDTSGLKVTTEVYRIGTRAPTRQVSLVCERAEHRTTFAALAVDVLEAIRQAPADPIAAVQECLDRWRVFWRVQPAGLTQEAALGLFAELWFLRFWMAGPPEEAVRRWTGPTGERHDFQWPELSVEVKASAVAPGTMHRIGSLDQLDDPTEGSLCLFSLHVADDALSQNTLPAIVQAIRSTISASAEATAQYDRDLAAVGYSPAHADRYERRFRVVSERLYRVDDEFPRLTRRSFADGLPSGVVDVAYTIDLTACPDSIVCTGAGGASLPGLR